MFIINMDFLLFICGFVVWSVFYTYLTTWTARGANKQLKAAKKHLTQDEFKQQMGILVDFVKQCFRTTNDGNTARRFLEIMRNLPK